MIVSAFTEEEIELLRPQPTYPRWANKQSQIINAANAKCLERNEWRAKCSAIQDENDQLKREKGEMCAELSRVKAALRFYL